MIARLGSEHCLAERMNICLVLGCNLMWTLYHTAQWERLAGCMQTIVLKLQGGTGSGPLQTFCKTAVDIAPHAGCDDIESELIALPMPFTKASGFGNAAQGQPLLTLRISLKALQVGMYHGAPHIRARQSLYGCCDRPRCACMPRPLIKRLRRQPRDQPVSTAMDMAWMGHRTRHQRNLPLCRKGSTCSPRCAGHLQVSFATMYYRPAALIACNAGAKRRITHDSLHQEPQHVGNGWQAQHKSCRF